MFSGDDGKDFVDIYKLLGLDFDTCTLKDVRKQFRVKSLTCHPDKVGPDNVEAANLFHQLKEASELLQDPIRKQAYDDRYKSKLARKRKLEQQDKKRREMSEHLEAREQAYKRECLDKKQEAAFLSLQINQQRLDNMERMREYQRKAAQKVDDIKQAASLDLLDTPKNNEATIRVQWRTSQLQITKAELESLFHPLGTIENILISEKPKKTTALISYTSILSAFNAIKRSKTDSSMEALQVDWANKQPPDVLEKLLSFSESAQEPPPPDDQDLSEVEILKRMAEAANA